ncbi:MAG: hypothetical protein V3S69_03825 [Dehalococcoidales bacterium]
MTHAELDTANITVDNKKVAGIQASGEKGQTIIVEGAADSVASGYAVSVYWDDIQAWNGATGLLNTSSIDNDGGFEIWFDVPQDSVGTHQLWYTATDQTTTARDARAL